MLKKPLLFNQASRGLLPRRPVRHRDGKQLQRLASRSFVGQRRQFPQALPFQFGAGNPPRGHPATLFLSLCHALSSRWRRVG
jgi:hypothetical protein